MLVATVTLPCIQCPHLGRSLASVDVPQWRWSEACSCVLFSLMSGISNLTLGLIQCSLLASDACRTDWQWHPSLMASDADCWVVP